MLAIFVCYGNVWMGMRTTAALLKLCPKKNHQIFGILAKNRKLDCIF